MPDNRFIRRLKKLAPGQALILYYAMAIMLGTVMLSFPFATTGKPLGFLDALFTATSAQCVTGLTVIDTGSGLSFYGQLVVLTLVQLGGLGIMTFSVYFFFFLRLGVGIKGRWIIHETLLHTPVSSLRDLIGGIIRMTLAIEAAGVLLLSFAFVPEMGFSRGLYAAVFHAISAFCNAGFSIFPESLVSYRSNVLVNMTMISLIVLGGIGFLVLREVRDVLSYRGKGRGPRVSLHSRIVLTTTVVLILGGALIIGFLENGSAFEGMSLPERAMTAFFQSVTARTAGFNTIDMGMLRISTLLLITFLMFIGASPGSAGGGIKTTSIALFIAIIVSRLRGSQHTNVFKRTISDETITRTLALVMLAILAIVTALFALLLVQHPGVPVGQNDDVFLQYLFETVSAFGTVGLSMGATAKLTWGGKLITIVLMFVGRVGLLTIAFSISKKISPYAPRYAEENIMIG